MKKTYSEKLKDPRWQKKRLEIFNRDKWKCKLCGDTETTLNVHHKEYVNGKDPCEYESEKLITLCEHCHKEIEEEKNVYVNFDLIKIYKSVNWKGGSRIMYSSCGEGCSMKIYDENDKYIIGYNLHSDIQEIIKILKYSQKWLND